MEKSDEGQLTSTQSEVSPEDNLNNVMSHENIQEDSNYFSNGNSSGPIYGDSSSSSLKPSTSDDPPPPSYIECTTECPHSEEDVRAALLIYTKNSCCCCVSSSPVQEMTIHEITPMHAFRYVLETFAENRILIAKSEPFKNDQHQPFNYQPHQSGNAPDKWSVRVECPPASMFSKSKVKMDLPQSNYVTQCHKCLATGFTSCTTCNGLGFSPCLQCQGTGIRSTTATNTVRNYCLSCSGVGRKICTFCQMGRASCKTCKGHKSMRHWISLEINWTHSNEFFVPDRGELTGKMLHKAHRSEVIVNKRCTGDNPRPLTMVSSSIDSSITTNAKWKLSNQCSSQNENKKILEFQQRIEIIPVAKVIFKYQEEEGHFYIYGTERLIYFPDGYPKNCCCCKCRCCCTIA